MITMHARPRQTDGQTELRQLIPRYHIADLGYERKMGNMACNLKDFPYPETVLKKLLDFDDKNYSLLVIRKSKLL